jgi:hypothetical protein
MRRTVRVLGVATVIASLLSGALAEARDDGASAHAAEVVTAGDASSPVVLPPRRPLSEHAGDEPTDTALLLAAGIILLCVAAGVRRHAS